MLPEILEEVAASGAADAGCAGGRVAEFLGRDGYHGVFAGDAWAVFLADLKDRAWPPGAGHDEAHT
jgi:2-polyprenyl-3-methyl-5-hydroxy-6-metoxy-1,4-benzoquinol methylase